MNFYVVNFIIFAIGTAFGSFLNLVSERVVNGEPILVGRSHCDFCKTKLKAKNLVPILSFLFQRGKSMCCREKLSWLYPISEFLTGAAFLFAAHYSNVINNSSSGNSLAFIYLVVIFCFFIVLFLTDLKYQLLPDKITYPAIIVAIIFVAAISAVALKMDYDQIIAQQLGKYLIQAGLFNQHILIAAKGIAILIASSLFISLFFVGLMVITKGRGMGGGDVKLGFLIGIFNGFPGNMLAVFTGFLLGALYSLILIITRKKKMKDTIAFGPFLIMGSIITLIWGEQIIRWYLRLF
jgi:leader peptidase (prepilin peptidase) / N-methyltransferase